MDDKPDYKALSRGMSSDMTPEAIERRLDIAAQLWKAANELGRSTYVGKVEPDRDGEDGGGLSGC